MIDPQTVAKIHDAAKIEEVVGDFVSLRKRGANLVGLCPFHNEKTGSFNVSPARGIFKCFGCGEGGNAVRFLMLYGVDRRRYYVRRLARPGRSRDPDPREVDADHQIGRAHV